MPERFEVEAVPASEIRKGDRVWGVGRQEDVVAVETHDHLLRFWCSDPLDPLEAPPDRIVLRVVAARGGTEDELGSRR